MIFLNKNVPRLKKITINIPTKLYNEINTLAIGNGLTFTSQTISLLRNGIDQNNALNILPDVLQQLLKAQKQPKKSISTK